VFVYLDDADYAARYVDPVLTVYESLNDGHLVGFQIKGLAALLGDSLKAVNWETDPPIIRLLFESFRLHPDGVESATLARTYARVAVATAKALRLQTA
jgi:hypothetical protein